ncbi:aminoglycoside phosphotransferase family protein [Paenibacillus sp. IB182496]|uniref:Aminoglycoside phosphotransferase family protein n=1 Tax=Paenibacillus sabuli TaxID=2772509 RepID=A0A927BQ42_9BACL|nr:aminoglycoside phosphotransferase family protein [Paenibacillus sabuli]MBD2843876.1 aminoglycoside phosphotransferase family protein [Paenibacillus sabuli]
MTSMQQELPERAQRWVCAALGEGTRITSVRPLAGGISSLVHLLAVENGAARCELVLRRFDNARWLREEPELAEHEAASLALAQRCGVGAPRAVAYDTSGAGCGMPAVLMTKVEGENVLRPVDLPSWLDELARTLAAIHRSDADRIDADGGARADCQPDDAESERPDAGISDVRPSRVGAGDADARSFRWRYFTYVDLTRQPDLSWSAAPARWQAALARVRGPRPEPQLRFIHCDYHAANVLWHGGRICAVVDWVNACIGPVGVDVGHCRVDLAQLHGVAAADLFLEAYVRHAGPDFRYELYWDLLSAIDVLEDAPGVYGGWAALGVTDLTPQLVRGRLDAYVASLLARAEED